MCLLFININLKSSENNRENGLPATFNAVGSSIIKVDNKATYCISGRILIRKISVQLLSLGEIRTRINGYKKVP